MAQIFSSSMQLLFHSPTGTFLLILLPIVIPIFFLYAFWVIRLRWVMMKFVEAQKACLLEIKLPKEVLKSPAAMEIFFSYLSQGGAATYADIFLDGRTRPWFSCELVSVGGDVKFFIWCSQAKFKTIIESQLYAQYPNIEVHEVPEGSYYTDAIDFDLEKYVIFGMQYALTQPDPYPIKTYVDYGLDQDQKDEYKIDPLTSVLEFLGSIKPGENLWMQILIQKHDKEGWKHGMLEKYARDFKAEVKGVISDIKKKATFKGEEEDSGTFLDMSKSQGEVISAVERKATKQNFDCMIRSMYIAEKPAFNATNIGGLIGSLRQYGANHLNGFKGGWFPDVSATRKDFARFLPFLTFLKTGIEKEVVEMKDGLFHAYKLRSYFQLPYKHYGPTKPFVLNTEELATLFHFPSGIVSQTPTLKRVGSKKSEAPANLPI